MFREDEILQRALSLLGRGGYNLFHNNCQHIVSYILTGTPKSPDIERAKGMTALVGGFSLAVGMFFWFANPAKQS
ncbi:MAG: lecithin retinol acyltransferase family protein [Myxococcales bacterium]|nr:lecithin retinol acyltransferase family protein [Myxococcales bacterium]